MRIDPVARMKRSGIRESLDIRAGQQAGASLRAIPAFHFAPCGLLWLDNYSAATGACPPLGRFANHTSAIIATLRIAETRKMSSVDIR